MNNPLRYRGYTFFQAGFDNNDTTTVLQVAQNPSWLVPYISCALIVARDAASVRDASGQFCETQSDRMRKFVPWVISLVLLVWAVSKMLPPKESPGFDVPGFGKLPVLVDGRVMPMDTLARLTLSEMNHHGAYTTARREYGATEPGADGDPHEAGAFGYGKAV